MPPTYIESLQNPRVKFLASLKNKRQRKREGKFLIEGEREVIRAREAGIAFEQIFLCEDFYKHSDTSAQLADSLLEVSTPVVMLDPKVFKHLSLRDNPDGFLALAKTFDPDLDRLTLSDKPFLLILEALEKPGNLGTILRTADAVGIDAVIVTDPVTDLFNPNVIRASAGVVFKVPVAVCDNDSLAPWLKEHGIHTVATTPDTDLLHFQADYSGPVAILMGSEKDGLAPYWLDHADTKVRLPMHGQADSLNVGAATAAVLYEAVRQRYTPKEEGSPQWP